MSTLKVNSIEEATSGGGTIFPARAWVNFDGEGTVSIRDDGHISSITDNSIGNYTINFSSSLANSNYCCNMSATDDGTGTNKNNGYAYGSWLRSSTSVVYNTGSIRIGIGYPANSSHYDVSHINVSIVGD